MDICRIDYVGGEHISEETYVREVCNNISQLSQQWTDDKGRVILDTSEELFQKFIRFVSNLPEDTETWTLSVPSTYLTVLHDVLKKKITTSSFHLPKQSSLHTRTDHINGMRTIKNEATRVFDELQERQQEIQQGFSLLNTQNNKRAFVGLYTNKSLAEETLEKYKGPPGNGTNNSNVNATDIEVRKGTDGNLYPFHTPTQYLSQYPVGFRGCFVCGSTDHWRKDSCPITQSGNFNRCKFFHDLWAHKPHTYTKRDGVLYQDSRKKQALVTTPGMYLLHFTFRFTLHYFSDPHLIQLLGLGLPFFYILFISIFGPNTFLGLSLLFLILGTESGTSTPNTYGPSRDVDNRPAWITKNNQETTPAPTEEKSVSWLDTFTSGSCRLASIDPETEPSDLDLVDKSSTKKK